MPLKLNPICHCQQKQLFPFGSICVKTNMHRASKKKRETLPFLFLMDQFLSHSNSFLWTQKHHYPAVLDRRPKFYGRSRRFKTYGYGYGGRSLSPFLRPKVFFVISLVFFSKMEAETCFSLHRCHLIFN